MRQALTPRRAWTLAAIPVVLLLLSRVGVVVEGDAFWQARAGLNLLDGLPIVHGDVLSWYAAGNEWTPNSWGWNIVLALSWKALGFAGLGWTLMAVLVTLYGFLAVQSSRKGASPTFTSLTLVLGTIPLVMWLSPRPQVFTYLMTVMAVALTSVWLSRASNKRRVAAAGGLFALQVVAINMHFSALVIVFVVVCAVACHLAARENREPRAIAISLLPVLLLIAGSMCSPVGVHIVGHGLFVRNESVSLITEWDSAFRSPSGLLALLFGAFGLFCSIKNKQWLTAGSIVAALLLASSAVRFAPLAVVLAVPDVAAWLSRSRLTALTQQHRAVVWVAAVVFSVVMTPLALAGVLEPGKPDPSRFDKKAAMALPAGCRLLNTIDQGDYLALVRPDVPLAMDGRNDLYGSQRLREYLEVFRDRSDADRWLGEHGITCISFGFNDRESPALVERLRNESAWRTVYVSRSNIVLVRR